ncbi:MAG: hypothetical protein ACI4XN_07190 [Candidatus Kurthia intestinigallinarum]
MTKSTGFFTLGLLAAGASLFTLFLLNIALFTHTPFIGMWYVPLVSLVLACIALTQKESRKYGLYALLLTSCTVLIAAVILWGLVSINGAY